ncbi:MAG: YkvA family protein [Clostridia bacterium]|nr:YkvA family protein [Clostridia bacterium]
MNYWEMGPVLLRLPRYGKLLVSLSQEPTLTLTQRLTLAGAVVYTFSPVDLIPGVIPLLGQLDDLVLLLIAIRRTVYRCPGEVRRRHLKKVGLTLEEVEGDYRLLVSTARVLITGVTRLATEMGALRARELRRLGKTIGQGSLLGLGMMRQAMAGSR